MIFNIVSADPLTHQPYTIEKDGFRTTFYSMVGQYGTHVDPPAHFKPDGATMDVIPLSQSISPLEARRRRNRARIT